jgi:catechol 2,3-dioxygenase-like lactoylglutathione lyase family enzyme
LLKVIQIGLNSSDLAGSLRLYSEAFGFRNSGAQAVWGKTIGIQGLGPESRAIIWWMVGANDFFQLELFHHSVPVQRPLPADWKPSDHGWVRFGLEVPDFDTCLAALARHGIEPLAPMRRRAGTRHVAIRDPYVGVVIEVIESQNTSGERPKVAYITSSVADLDAARRYYGTLLQLPILPIEILHTSEDERLWNLPAATPGGFVADAGGLWLEIVRYPEGRPKAADYRISDQGIMNIALGSHEKTAVAEALARLREAGLVPPFTYDEGPIICGYILNAGHEVELTAVPSHLHSLLGFDESPAFLV